MKFFNSLGAILSLFIIFSLEAKPQIQKTLIKVVLFDMEGVLTKTSHLGMAKEIGACHIFNISIDMINGYFSYFFFDQQPPFMQKRLFQTLEKIGGSQLLPSGEFKATHKGALALPQLMCDWMTDKQSPAHIRTLIRQEIKKLYQEGFFISKKEMRYIRHILLRMFCSDILARHVHPIKEGINLLEDIASLHQKSKGVIFGILSNAASEPFALKQNDKELNSIFKHMHAEYIFVSGKMGTIKPYSTIYLKVIEKLKNNGVITLSSEILFIDDQEENVIAARKQGITALHLKDFDYKTLRNQLKSLTIL